MRFVPLALTVLAAGCGGGSSSDSRFDVAPTAPSTLTVTGTLSNTVTGSSLGTFSRPVAFLPAVLEFTADGYYPRTTRITRQGQDVDLFPLQGFDLDFYREFARDGLRGTPVALRVLDTTTLSFYVQVEGATGFARQLADSFESVARRVVPDTTGGRVRVGQWETGTAARALSPGWVIVERTDEDSDVCGRALVGQPSGHIWVDSNRSCNPLATFAHEIGHALGFTHVTRPGSMMLPEQRNSNLNDAPTEMERVHGAAAYRRPRGNRDLDLDP